MKSNYMYMKYFKGRLYCYFNFLFLPFCQFIYWQMLLLVHAKARYVTILKVHEYKNLPSITTLKQRLDLILGWFHFYLDQIFFFLRKFGLKKKSLKDRALNKCPCHVTLCGDGHRGFMGWNNRTLWGKGSSHWAEKNVTWPCISCHSPASALTSATSGCICLDVNGIMWVWNVRVFNAWFINHTLPSPLFLVRRSLCYNYLVIFLEFQVYQREAKVS